MSEINIEEILRKSEFDELSHNTKLELIKVSNEIKNKSNIEAFKIIGDFHNRVLKKENLSPKNKKAVYSAITSSLDSKTRKQFDLMLESLSKKI